MTRRQRELLIQHLTGPQAIIVSDGDRLGVLRKLRERGLVRYDAPLRPRHSLLTAAGRNQAIRLLAAEAERLADQ